MHKNYCNICHQPVHGYRNLCPEWTGIDSKGESQNGHVPDREPEIDEWDWGEGE